MTEVTRFAPSPTGHFHVGGARTALFNFVVARKTGGKFFLRIEDTDDARYQTYAVTELIQSLAWLGMSWDAGPTTDELISLSVNPELAIQFGKERLEHSYVQSKRSEIYTSLAMELMNRGEAYPVFTDREIDESGTKWSKLSALNNIGQWREASPFHIRKAMATGRDYYIMLRLPRYGGTVVHDTLRGDIEIPWNRKHDLVILKPNKLPTYHMASVIDDHFHGTTHVIRGSEWLDSLPVHKYLYGLFGWDAPKFTHLPLILNPSGKGKLSKRKGQEVKDLDGKTVVPTYTVDYMRQGFLAEAMINFLALVGWNPGDGKEILSLSEIVNRFDLARVNTTAARWNYKKLLHLNTNYISNLSDEQFADIAESFLNNI